MIIVNGVYAKLLILFALTAWVVESKDEDIDPGNSTAIQECAAKFAKKFAHIKIRFSDAILQENCKQGAKWVKQAKAPPQQKKPVSDAQLNWLTDVWKCQDLLCICRSAPSCNNFLSALEIGNDKLKGLSLGANSKFYDLNSFFKNNVPMKTNGRFKRQTQQQIIFDVIQGKVGKAIRKEIRMLNGEEKAAFFTGINKLKQEKIGDKNKYDILNIYYTPEESPGAHFCASFFPFHRELLKNFEVAMRELEPMAALPFWDPTLDQPLPNPADSMIWTDEFLGNGDGPVTVGQFASWMTLPDSQAEQFPNSVKINRGLGKSPYGRLPKDVDIETIMSKNSFKDLTFCNEPFVELIHGTTRMWVGGHSVELRTSPNDPTFFLLHNYFDYIWEQWRQQKQSRMQRETDYTSDSESCNAFCYGSAPMKPFPIRNSDGLLSLYSDNLLFAFQPRPTCNRNTKNCGSPYLFCDSRTIKCVGKVKVTGNCTGFESEDICYKSQCRGGRCVLDGAAATTLVPTFPPPTPRVVTVPPVVTAPKAPTTTTTATLPPTLVTVPPTSSPVKTVWIPITVLNQVERESRAYPDAAIISTDPVHAVKFRGVISNPTKVPYYTGASLAQVLNPFTVSDAVQAKIQVFDRNMQECTSQCLNAKTHLYDLCVANVSISSNILSNQDIAYSPDFEQAWLLNWKGNGRILDKFMFICHAPDTSTTISDRLGPILAGARPGLTPGPELGLLLNIYNIRAT